MENVENGNQDPNLDTLRERIDLLDTEIVRLLAERKQVVDHVAAFKKAHQLPVYHPAREEDLISRRRIQAETAGLDPNHIEEIFRAVIRKSRIAQSSDMASQATRPGATVLLVGGNGGMGRFFQRCFRTAGYHVRILDKDDWPDADRLCAGVDLVMVGVPIDVSCEVIRQLGPKLSSGAVLCDITSIQEPTLAEMLHAHHGPVIGFHPLFGPTTSTLDKQIVVASPGRDAAACQWILDQFALWGAVVLHSSAREHDDIMGIVQALRHFATFAFGRFLYRNQVSLARTLEFSSPIYRLELGMVGRLFAQDASLYSEIIFASPNRRRLLVRYLESLSQTRDMLESGDKKRFQEEFHQIAEWFGPFSDQSMRESTFLIDRLIERF